MAFGRDGLSIEEDDDREEGLDWKAFKEAGRFNSRAATTS
jgi:hypothetical protein